MGAPIRRHVVDGNMSSEVPVCLNVSIKSEGVGDFVIFERDSLFRLNADRSGYRARGAHPAFIQLIFNVQRMTASVAKLARWFAGVGQNTINGSCGWAGWHLRC